MKIKNYLAGMIGTALEYYDYMLFSSLAPLLSPLFFPTSSPTSALIKTYGIQFIGVIMRPLGSFLFGKIGDNYGRKKALTYSMLCMATATGCMALVPTFSQVGIFAPILMIICRMIQGMSVGGEVNGAAIFVLEHTKERYPNLASGFFNAFTVSGVFVASFVSYFCSLPSAPIYAWRLAFGFGLLAGFGGLIIRYFTDETPLFLKHSTKKNINIPFYQVFTNNKFAFFCVMVIGGFYSSGYYFTFTFLNGFLPLIGKISQAEAYRNGTIMLASYALSSVVAGYLADYRVGSQKMMKFSSFLLIFTSYPLMLIINHVEKGIILPFQIFFAIIAGFYVGPMHALIVRLFPINSRYQAISVSYSIGSCLLGASTPIFCMNLWKLTNDVPSVSFWIMATASFAFIGVTISKSILEKLENKEEVSL